MINTLKHGLDKLCYQSKTVTYIKVIYELLTFQDELKVRTIDHKISNKCFVVQVNL